MTACQCGSLLIPGRDGIGARKCESCRAAANTRYFARRRAAAVRPATRALVIARDGMTCRYCFRPVRLRRDKYDSGRDTIEVDHLIPAKYGGGEATNLVVACLGCNRRRDGSMRVAHG